MNDNVKPLFEVTPIASSVAADLRRLADMIDAGEYSAETGVAVLHSNANEIVTRHSLGQRVTYTSQMGLLAYAQQMLFKEAIE